VEKFTIGMSASYEHTITDSDIKNFAGISGDYNPVHISDAYAEASKFKKRIAHGLMSASYFSAIFGTKLPGEGCVYVNQNLNFKKPVYIGDTVKATVTIKDMDEKRRRLFFDTVCTVNDRIVISGEAEIYIPK
jgi:3-hydroxybutyryl-CoA dehydratase